jgi:uncharacterized membrane protein (UPF0136 family)
MKPLSIAVIIYGVIMIGLGLLAYFDKGSWQSLVGGGAIGLLAVAGGFVAKSNPMIGYGMAALASVAALGRFAPVVIKEGKIWPAGVITALSALTLIALVVGHFTDKKPS